jgi:hypothetical protein
VRSSGFEPPRYCYRQPLKLVRLPVPPRPHRGEIDILTGRKEGCKLSYRTPAAGWFASPLKQIRKQFLLLGRPLPEESEPLTNQMPTIAKAGIYRLVDARARKAP